MKSMTTIETKSTIDQSTQTFHVQWEDIITMLLDELV